MEIALELAGEAHDAIGFRKACIEVEADTGLVGDLAVTGKFRAALGFCPCLAGIEELGGIALMTTLIVDEQAFQIAYRAGGSALNVIVAELALSGH